MGQVGIPDRWLKTLEYYFSGDTEPVERIKVLKFKPLAEDPFYGVTHCQIMGHARFGGEKRYFVGTFANEVDMEVFEEEEEALGVW